MAISKPRASKGFLREPSTSANVSAERRSEWFRRAVAGFVQPSVSNKAIYEVLLSAFWPAGHGIPGPILTETDVRNAVDAWYRNRTGKASYKDVFRRLRELQGEEGFTSIIKEGARYQLQSLDVGQKREPREQLSAADWNLIREKFGYKCAHCGTAEPEAKLSPDHRQPRLRGGGNELQNLQPLCEQCNNLKSSACQGCRLNCFTCPWAFPEKYKPILIADDNREQLRRVADKEGMHPADLANKILSEYFNKKR